MLSVTNLFSIEAQEEIGSQAEESETANFYKDKAATIVFCHIDVSCYSGG
jgi:hypothetical protein